MEYNIYRLKHIKPISFQLPLKEVFVKKIVENKDLGYRRITYVPGTDTIFAEDQKGDLQPQSIWFENGDVRARQDDKLLNTIMKEHPWYGVKYELWSEEAEEEAQLEDLRFKSKVTQLIDDSDKDEIKAIAMAVFGHEAGLWNNTKAELRLRNKAKDEPKELKKSLEGSDYQGRFMAGMAFVHKIVQENKNSTAVVWTDSDGIIVKLAKGENGVNELGRLLSQKSEESKKVVQSLGERLDKLVVQTSGKPTDEILSEKDQEIAELRARLAEKEDSKEDPALLEARENYTKVTGKNVPNNMKNNIEWLKENAVKPSDN